MIARYFSNWILNMYADKNFSEGCSFEILDECSDDFQEFLTGSPCNIEANDEDQSKIIQLWTDGETKMLLDQYATYLPRIGPLKKFKKKKDMWEQIASEIGSKTWKQCEQRYKTVLKRKKSAVDNNSSTGAKRIKIEFEEELEKINKLDDSIEPDVQISSQAVIRKCINDTEEASTSKAVKKKPKSLQESMLDVIKKKEEGKERRHREKMEKADRFENLLTRIIEKN